MKKLSTLVFLLSLFTGAFSIDSNAQSTWSEVYDIIQTKCAGCHSGDSPSGNLSFDQSSNELYNFLIDGAVTNPYADGKNYKQVVKGQPDKSFLFRKSNGDLYKESILEPAEGQIMPPYGAPELTDAETETIRQWILYGAGFNNQYFDVSILEEYYEDPSQHLERLTMEAPDPSEGFQLHLGTIFLEPGAEEEYYWKYPTELLEGVEINEIDVVMNDFSHHFLFFKYDTNDNPNADPDGLEDVGIFNADIGEKMIGGWSGSAGYKLPEGTAYKWPADTYLKFNFHVKNYSTTQILPSDVFVNVYTQPEGTAIKEMHSDFILYSNPLPCFLGGEFCIEGGESQTFEDVVTRNQFEVDIPNNTDINIFMLGGHTHKFGTDYDIFRNDNGVLGEKIYDATYNYDDPDNIFDTGFYDYGEPPVVFYNPMNTVNGNDGIVHRASYTNTSSTDVGFGLTTNDEMMGIFIQYTIGDISELPTGIEDGFNEADLWSVSPNPYSGTTQIAFNLTESSQVQLDVYNVTGQKVSSIENANLQAGAHTYNFSAASNGWPEGLYIATLNIDGKIYTKNMIENR